MPLRSVNFHVLPPSRRLRDGRHEVGNDREGLRPRGVLEREQAVVRAAVELPVLERVVDLRVERAAGALRDHDGACRRDARPSASRGWPPSRRLRGPSAWRRPCPRRPLQLPARSQSLEAFCSAASCSFCSIENERSYDYSFCRVNLLLIRRKRSKDCERKRRPRVKTRLDLACITALEPPARAPKAGARIDAMSWASHAR